MDQPWMTPAQARELAAAVEELAGRIDEARAARGGDPDEARQLAGFRLDEIAGQLRLQVDELLATAEDLARLAARPRRACPALFGVCPEHGNTLSTSGSRSWCTEPGCHLAWDHPRGVEPCTEPVTHRVVDPAGRVLEVCDGHTVDAGRRITGATIIPLPD